MPSSQKRSKKSTASKDKFISAAKRTNSSKKELAKKLPEELQHEPLRVADLINLAKSNKPHPILDDDTQWSESDMLIEEDSFSEVINDNVDHSRPIALVTSNLEKYGKSTGEPKEKGNAVKQQKRNTLVDIIDTYHLLAFIKQEIFDAPLLYESDEKKYWV